MRKLLLSALAAVSLFGSAASAQEFPTKPITMVIPFAAGGPQDTIGRVFAQRMSEILGQQVVVENVGGAGGMTGGKRVADAAPDGYTMILASVGTHAQNQTLYKKPLYDAAKDFAPIAFLAETPIAVITRKDLPVNNFKEFVAYAKANADKMTYGSAGAGIGDASCLRRARFRHGHQDHARSLSRHRPCDAGPAGRTHRLSLRHHRDREVADRRRHREGLRDHDQGSLAGAAQSRDDRRTGPRRAGLYLERAARAQGHATRCDQEIERSRRRAPSIRRRCRNG